ncbi:MULTISPECIES: hypothetical protein [Streptomyces]|uniref:hypothetical protein n=1 Tax=Streptomyces TaxID=1883 RepID=UPI0022B568BB|nr:MULTISPECIES: hypothetical protein [Streptomyces]MCZ4509402.1 hypothetical protein [Streptomyces sp. ActVer]
MPRIYPTLNQATAIQFLDCVIQRLPFQARSSRRTTAPSSSPPSTARARQAHRPTYIKPRTPRLNGKAERSQRVDAEEVYRLLDGAIIDDAEVFNDKLREWEDYYSASSRRPRPRRNW